MSTENDAPPGADGISMDDAINRFVASQSNAAPTGQAEEEVEDEPATDDELPEGDEPDGEEAEDTDTEGQAEDEDAEPESDQGRFVSPNGKVKLPDGSIVPVADLIQGNLRDRDYRQKTMAVAEERRAIETQSTAIKEQQQRIEEQASLVLELLQSQVPPMPDIAMTDPTSPKFDFVGYTQQKARHEEAVARIQQLHQHRQLAQQQSQAEAEAQRAKKAEAEWTKLLTKAPELGDRKRLDAFVSDIRTFGPKYELTDDEVRSVALDHRLALILRKAIAYDKLQTAKPKVAQKVEGRPPITKSGKRLTPDVQRSKQAGAAMDRLKQSGSTEDAVAAYLARLNKG